jgi:hypothetical protein
MRAEAVVIGLYAKAVCKPGSLHPNLFPAYGLYTLRDKIVQGDRNGNDGGGWEWLEILGPSGTTVRTSAKSCG